MIELDLYKNYNLSLADIHKQKSLDLRLHDKKPISGKQKLNAIIAAIVLFMLLLITIALLIRFFIWQPKPKMPEVSNVPEEPNEPVSK